MSVRALLAAAVCVALCAAPPAAEAERIVSLAPSITETLFAVGAGAEIVGVSDHCDWPPRARALPRVGSYLQPNVEAVLARRPDLVLAVPSPGNREPIEALEALGLRVVVVREGPALADVLGSIVTIGEASGHAAAAVPLVAGIRRHIAAVEARVSRAPRRRVLAVLGRNPLVAAGEGTLLDDCLRRAGAENVAVGLGAWPRISMEYVVKTSPDVILEPAMGGAPADPTFWTRLGLAAPGHGTIVTLKLDELLRPGPRIADGIEKLARLVHPEAFP